MDSGVMVTSMIENEGLNREDAKFAEKRSKE